MDRFAKDAPLDAPTAHFGRDTVTVNGTYGEASLIVDKTTLNDNFAVNSILLVVFVLLVLGIFVAALHMTLSRTLVAPLERIFASVQKNACQIVAAF